MVLALTPVRDALSAGVLEDEVLLGVWVPDDLALVELAGGGGHGAWVIVGSLASGSIATTAIVGGLSAWWVVVGDCWRLESEREVPRGMLRLYLQP